MNMSIELFSKLFFIVVGCKNLYGVNEFKPFI